VELAMKATLTPEERKIIKALLSKGEKNQTILALINTNRHASVNGGRITEVKKDTEQLSATDVEVQLFRLKKVSFDPKTTLNQFDDERLVRSREAMIPAVQIFNSASLKFKSEVFSVLSNIAWTYLLHEYYDRKGVPLVHEGRSMVLSQMLDRHDCPLNKGVKDNLRSIKILRDQVEHLLLGPADTKWYSLFQACCLNYDKAICELFGPLLTLSHDLSFALQFAKPDISHLATLMEYPLPARIEAVDARITAGLTDEDLRNIEYQFKVVYTLDSASKSQANVHFINPGSETGIEIHNVLAKKVSSDELYPLRVTEVVSRVQVASELPFTTNLHQRAWKLFRVRPLAKAANPGQTDKRYCIYHPAHKDYTYSTDWVDRLVSEVSDPVKFGQIKSAPA
jgi:Protein of unknown function (DUF3644)